MRNRVIFREFESLLGNGSMDTIANILTILLNGQGAQKKRVAVPFSQFNKRFLEFMKEKNYIGDIRLQESPRAKLIVSLAYDESGTPAMLGARRISKPGKRVYASSRDLPYTQQDTGMIVVSTPEGLMDEKHARGKGIGGELICAIW